MVDGQSRRLLVVDDDPQIGRFLAKYLEREGSDIAVAMDGEAMRARISEENFNLVILDLTMPGDDGLTLRHKLRNRSNVGIIILTGKEGSVERVVGLELGAGDYVSKPFDERELLARIRSVLRWSATQPEAESNGRILGFGSFRLRIDSREIAHAAGRSWSPYDRPIDTVFVKLGRKLGDDPKIADNGKIVHCVGYMFAPAVEGVA